MGLPVWEGWYQQEQLNKEMQFVRARGEPILPEDFSTPAIADAENAALVLRAGARVVDTSSENYKKYGWVELGLPLSDEEMQIIGTYRDGNPIPLARLHEARGRRGVDWQIPLTRPVMWILLPDLNEQKELTNLGLGDLIWQHQMGNDRAAVERVKDLLAQSRAVDRVPLMVSHMVSLGIVASTMDKVTAMSPTLRIGQSEGALAPQEVRNVIAELLDEKWMAEGRRRAVHWERISNLDALRSLQDGKSNRKGEKDFPISRFTMKGELLADARLVLERWTEIAGINDQASNWPGFEQALKVKTKVVMRIEAQNDDFHLLKIFALNDCRFIERHWGVITWRRLAATALAIRLYEVEQGRLPENLAALVPQYLPAVPLDPLTEAKQLGYLADARRPVVYSVGRNGTDEGGSDTPLPKTIEPRFWDREDAVVHLRAQHREFRPVREPASAELSLPPNEATEGGR